MSPFIESMGFPVGRSSHWSGLMRFDKFGVTVQRNSAESLDVVFHFRSDGGDGVQDGSGAGRGPAGMETYRVDGSRSRQREENLLSRRRSSADVPKFSPEALAAWGIDGEPFLKRRDVYLAGVASGAFCAFCQGYIKDDQLAYPERCACATCWRALVEGRMPARLSADGTLHLGCASLVFAVSDGQVKAFVSGRDSEPPLFECRPGEPIEDEGVFILGKSEERGLVDADDVVNLTADDGGVGLDSGVGDVRVGKEIDQDEPVLAGTNPDGVSCDVGSDRDGELGHVSSSVGDGMGTTDPTEEVPGAQPMPPVADGGSFPGEVSK